MENKLRIIFIIILEALAIWTLFSGYPANLRLAVFMILHAVASFEAAMLLWYYLPRHMQLPKIPLILLLTSFNTFVPVLGILAMLVAAIALTYFGLLEHRPIISALTMPAYMTESEHTQVKFGEGGALQRLQQKHISDLQRSEALMAISTENTPLSNQLLSATLHDESDQIRLLAFSLLDKQEKVISAKISEVMHSLEHENNATRKARLEKQLALLFWEYVYLGLSSGELREYMLKQAQEHAQSALHILHDDKQLLVLLGRLYMRAGQMKKAEDAFLLAQKSGALPSKVLPFLADMCYRKRDFKGLRQYITADAYLRDIPKVGPVIDFWSAHGTS